MTPKEVHVQTTDGSWVSVWEREKIEEIIVGEGFLGPKKEKRKVKKWYTHFFLDDDEADDIYDLLSQKGIGPRELEKSFVSRNIFHRELCEGGGPDGELAYYSEDDFVFILYKDHAIVYGRDRLYERKISNLANLRSEIVQYLKSRPDLEYRLGIES